MRTMHWAKLLQLMIWLVAGAAWAQLAPPSEENTTAWLARRQALFDTRKIDVPGLSEAITSAVRDGETMAARSQYQQALDRLKELERYMPLDEIPSFDVHVLAGRIHGQMGQPQAQQRHQDIASAYREVLWHRIGTGSSPADPLRVVMTSEIADWLKSHQSMLVDLRTMQAAGRELMRLTHVGPATSGQPSSLFVEIDLRTRQMMSRKTDLYEPVAIDQMRPQDAEWLRLARDKRARFLQDRSFVLGQLDSDIGARLAEATRLLVAGKPDQALATLRTLERQRAIEEIPTPGLLTMYSLLLGRTGDIARQAQMRGLVFGVQQAIAHSGDALSPATAIHVILAREEYDWLREKKLRLVRHRLLASDGQRYDVMQVRDEQGKESERFFNVTALFERYSDVLGNFDAAWRLAERQNGLPDVQRYLREWAPGLQTWRDGEVERRIVWPQEKAITECVTAVFPGPGKVRMIFIIDARGAVQDSLTDQSGWVDQCVKQKTKGMRVPPPQRVVMLCTRFEKTGEDRTVASGCGPAPIVQDCQQTGTSRACRIDLH